MVTFVEAGVNSAEWCSTYGTVGVCPPPPPKKTGYPPPPQKKKIANNLSTYV